VIKPSTLDLGSQSGAYDILTIAIPCFGLQYFVASLQVPSLCNHKKVVKYGVIVAHGH